MTALFVMLLIYKGYEKWTYNTLYFYSIYLNMGNQKHIGGQNKVHLQIAFNVKSNSVLIKIFSICIFIAIFIIILLVSSNLKLKNEIAVLKSDSLKLEENFKLLNDNGFKSIDIFIKWYNFCGMIAVK